MKHSRIIVNVILILLTSYALAVITSSFRFRMPSYLDEKIYMECGLAYVVNLTAPKECNFEHPPLGKYIFGLAIFSGFNRYLLALMFSIICVLTYLIAMELLNSRYSATLATALLTLDTIVLNTSRHYLLDLPAVTFALFGTYLYLRRVNSALVGFVYGLALSSKWSTAPYLLTPLILEFVNEYIAGRRQLRNVLKYLLLYITTLSITYLTTYSVDVLKYGFVDFVNHQIKMLNYMSYRHGFSLPIAVNGLLKLFTKVELWRRAGTINLTLNIINTSIMNYTETFIKESGFTVVLNVGAGSLTWLLTLPAFLTTTYKALTKTIERGSIDLAILSWLSIIPILAGPIDWYYINTLPIMYVSIASFIQDLKNHKIRRWLTLFLTTSSATTLLLTAFEVIPWKLTF